MEDAADVLLRAVADFFPSRSQAALNLILDTAKKVATEMEILAAVPMEEIRQMDVRKVATQILSKSYLGIRRNPQTRPRALLASTPADNAGRA